MEYPKEISFIKRVQAYNPAVPVNYYFQNEAKGWTFPKFLPGHVYTFDYLDLLDEAAVPSIPDYLDPNKLKTYTYQKPYFDSKPIGISLGRMSDGPDEYFIDLKMMPLPERLAAMEILMRGVYQVIQKVGLHRVRVEKDGEEYYEKQLRPLEERMRDYDYVSPFVRMNSDIFRNYLGRGFYFWVNKYNVSRMKDVSLIDFDVVEKIALSNYNYDRFVKMNGSTIQDVQGLYLAHVKNHT